MTRAWRHTARQDRSRRTERQLTRAATRLLGTRPFEEVRVADLARAAGVSVGGFYRRFRNKRAVLHLADLGFIEDCRQALDDAFDDPALALKPLSEVVRTYVRVMVAKFREHRRAILQVIRHADPADARVYRDRAMAFNDHVHGRFRAAIAARAEALTHPDPELAVNLAIFFASASARDAIWRGSLAAYPVAIDDERLIDEITRAFLGYLSS